MLCIERVEFYVSIVTWMTCLYLLYLSIVSSSHKKADKLIFAQKARMAYLSHFLNLRVCERIVTISYSIVENKIRAEQILSDFASN